MAQSPQSVQFELRPKSRKDGEIFASSRLQRPIKTIQTNSPDGVFVQSNVESN